MLDVIFVALFQAAIGDPTQVVEPPTAETAAAPAEAGEATQNPDDVIVCRRQTVVGTRLAQRVCMTAGQEREMREYAQREVRQSQSQQTWREGVAIPMPGPMGN